MSEWISVEERNRPTDSVLVYADYGKETFIIQAFWDGDDEEWYDHLDGELVRHVTHWQPLPTPPDK